MRIFAFYLAKMKYAPALGRISAYICVIKLVYHTLTQIAMAASPLFAMTATASFATVATAFPVQTPHELAPHSFCAANMAAAVDNRA